MREDGDQVEVMFESDDRLLLREMTHRTGNDYAAAIAALRLTAAGAVSRGRSDLVEQAIARLEASSAVHLLLAAPGRREVDAGALVRRICKALVEIRSEGSRARVIVDAGELTLSGELARRIALVAAELVVNALRHGLGERGRLLAVGLDRCEGMMRLVVSDDGPGMQAGVPASGTGWGRGIVSELVARAGGSLVVDTGPSGTTVKAVFPLIAANDMDDEIAF